MHEHRTPRRTGHLTALAAAMVVVLGSLAAIGATASTAGATGQIVTYTATASQPGALTNAYPSSADSDGWAVALSSTQVFNVTHHVPMLEVTCHNQSNGYPCWPQQVTKIVTRTSGSTTYNFATPVGAGLYLDQATGRLYTFAVETDGNSAQNVAGVVCIDTTQPVAAAGSSLYCGFTPLSKVGDTPIVTGLFASITAPVQVGSNWYAFYEAASAGPGGGGGTENTLMCFDLTTFAACPTANYTVPFNGEVTGFFGTAPPIGASGTDIFIPLNTLVSSVATVQLACFDTGTGAGSPAPGRRHCRRWPARLTRC